jgi:DNA-binding GntR family transcriptional regulator
MPIVSIAFGCIERKSLLTRLAPQVERIHDEVRQMAVEYRFKPGERLNEGDLSKELGVSRTPLREALNRLVAEGYLAFRPGQGFFCRGLSPSDVSDLYDARVAIETAAARLSCARAAPEEIETIRAFIASFQSRLDSSVIDERVAFDEAFHMRLAALSHNAELQRILSNINGRIRFVRCIYMENRKIKNAEHLAILDLIESGDADAADRLVRKHIERRREEINAAVREGLFRLYSDEPATPYDGGASRERKAS